MQIQLQQGAVETVEADVLVVPLFDGKVAEASALPAGLRALAGELNDSGEFAGKPSEIVTLYKPEGTRAKRLVFAGAGKEEKFDAMAARRMAAIAVRALKCKSLPRIHLLLPSGQASAEYVRAAVEGAILGDFEPDTWKTDPKKKGKRLQAFTVVVPAANEELERAAEQGRFLAEAQNYARDLVNEPANLLTPQALAEHARKMAAEVGLECEVLEEAQMRELGMGALLGVSQGSDNPAAFIILRYYPETPSSGDHLALIGKGVTFDTGGLSIKPHEGMEKMKYDMGGAGSVLGAMRAIAQLKPGVRITAVIPSVENMISGNAQRPGDIVTTMSGKTVEVLNTDAEGRLILADAITWAIRQGCTHLVDAATLTGAIVVALGHYYIGAFTNNPELLGRMSSAGEIAGDRMWQMPLDDDYKEYLKTPYADIPNIGGRYGGSITAAKFLEEFVEGKPWVHLDIAGTAWLDDGKPHGAKGPTGVPTRSFVHLAMNWGQ